MDPLSQLDRELDLLRRSVTRQDSRRSKPRRGGAQRSCRPASPAFRRRKRRHACATCFTGLKPRAGQCWSPACAWLNNSLNCARGRHTATIPNPYIPSAWRVDWNLRAAVRIESVSTMHPRRLACFILGLWLGGGLLVAWAAADSFRAVDRLLAAPSPEASLRLRALGPSATRALFRYEVRSGTGRCFTTGR